MVTTERYSPADMRRALEEAVTAEGMDFGRFVELGKADRLENSELRELWIIWGSSIAASD